MKLQLRDYPRIAIFVGLIAGIGFLPAYYTAGATGLVPITTQSLAVMLAGAILGSYRGALAVLIFEVLALAGLPILASTHLTGVGGIQAFTGPTVGYLFGWIIGAWTIGWIVEKLHSWNVALSTAIASVVGGIVLVYIPGILWYALSQGLPILAVASGNLVFIPFDALKVVIAVVVVSALKAAYPKGLEN